MNPSETTTRKSTSAVHSKLSSRRIRIAILGNPNSGKSTLFNALTGLNVRTGNYPGVTVEKRSGRAILEGRPCEFIDLPGVYSLAPQAEDELIAVKVSLGLVADEPIPDVLLCIASAENLERHLFLVSQALDLGIPTVVALNMWDSARARGFVIDAEGLSERLGVPVILTEAHRRIGLDEVRSTLIRQIDEPLHPRPAPLPAPFYDATKQLKAESTSSTNTSATNDSATNDKARPESFGSFFYERAILDQGGPLEEIYLSKHQDEGVRLLESARQALRKAGIEPTRVESTSRYQWVNGLCREFLEHKNSDSRTISDRLDAFLTHRILGMACFLATMLLIFQAIYYWSEPLVGGLEIVQQASIDWVTSTIGPGMLRSLLIDGVIAGVGTVLIFLPQIALLFLFIAILEDCGYMPRVAFMMDRLMSGLGLSGKSFIPLMSSFACAVPGVMATRVIENSRDRLVTVLVAPLMSCSARLPVYLLLISAFVPATKLGGFLSLQGLTLFGMSSIGAIVAVPVALGLRRFLFRGDQTPFVLELPEYKVPSLRVVSMRVFEQAKAFVIRAGTMILATTILVWAVGYFPGDRSNLVDLQRQIESLDVTISQLQSEVALNSTSRGRPSDLRASAVTASLKNTDESDSQPAPQLVKSIESSIQPETHSIVARKIAWQTDATDKVNELTEKREKLRKLANAESSRLLKSSLLGRAGRVIEPVVKPLGWDWKIGVGVIASFPAREVIISTLGTIYSLGGDVDEESAGLKSTLKASTWPDGRPVYNLPVAISIMVFFALCAQCASTLLVIRRETNSWKWPIFCFVYMTLLAYVGAFVSYQVGMMLA